MAAAFSGSGNMHGKDWRMNKPIDLRVGSGPRLKVWWIPQVPMKAFEVEVDSFTTAKVLLKALGNYDLFQLENNIKPDFCNTGGLCIWEDGLEPDDDGEKWTDWENDECDSIDDLTLSQCAELDAVYSPERTGV